MLVVEIATGERAAFLPLPAYEELELGERPPFGTIKEQRSFRFTPVKAPRMVVLDKLRIPDRHWIILSWEEVRSLGSILREQEGKRSGGKLVPRKKRWNSRGFGRKESGSREAG